VVLLVEIYDRLQCYLAIPSVSFLKLYAKVFPFLFDNVTGRGDCERNYTVNYLKKIEMPKRTTKKSNEDKCTINQLPLQPHQKKKRIKVKEIIERIELDCKNPG
jgi:hypothetical protein